MYTHDNHNNPYYVLICITILGFSIVISLNNYTHNL